ncbi:MAG: peptidylprolyl isomerase [Nitrospirae bacterium]|nr:peptidylprolyl isomerase [Nitrospirota bacterium]
MIFYMNNGAFRRIFLFIPIMLLFFTVIDEGIAAVTIDKIVAVVNNEVITLSELEDALQIPRKKIIADSSGKEQEQLLNKLTRDILDKMIEKKLQLQIARQRNITINQKEVDTALEDIKARNALPDDEALKRALAMENLTLEQYKKELTEQITIMRLVSREIRSNIVISETEIKGYYEENKNEYAVLEEVRLRVILFKEKDDVEMNKAMDVLNQIKNGADFADIARRYSEDPTAKDGGDIGFIKKGQMLPEFEKTALSLKNGEVSDIIKTPSGYYLIKVEDRKEAAHIPFEKVKEDIERKLYEKKGDTLYDEWLKDLRKNAHVEIKFQ